MEGPDYYSRQERTQTQSEVSTMSDRENSGTINRHLDVRRWNMFGEINDKFGYDHVNYESKTFNWINPASRKNA